MTTTMSESPELNAVATYLRMLSHPSRLAIALLLHDGPCAVSEIENALGLRQPNLSQHLGVLRDANVIAGSRRAKSVVYELAPGLSAGVVGAIRGTVQGALADAQPVNAVKHTPKPGPAAAVTARPTVSEPDDALVFAQVLGRRTET